MSLRFLSRVSTKLCTCLLNLVRCVSYVFETFPLIRDA